MAVHHPLPAHHEHKKVSPFDIAAWVLTAMTLLGALLLDLVSALLSGLLMYELARLIANKMHFTRIRRVQGRVIAIVVLVAAVIALLIGATVAGIASGQGLTIRGFANSDSSITATLILGQNKPVDPTKIVIQGVVEAFSASAHTVTILGIVIDASGATAEQSDQVITQDQFFAKLTVNKTIVKATGAFSAGPPPKLTASGIESD